MHTTTLSVYTAAGAIEELQSLGVLYAHTHLIEDSHSCLV
jgi:hypothetical protein